MSAKSKERQIVAATKSSKTQLHSKMKMKMALFDGRVAPKAPKNIRCVKIKFLARFATVARPMGARHGCSLTHESVRSQQ